MGARPVKVLSSIIALLLVFGLLPVRYVYAAHWSDDYYGLLDARSVFNADIGAVSESRREDSITREEFYALIVCGLYGQQQRVGEMPGFVDFAQIKPELSGYISKAKDSASGFGLTKDGQQYIAPKALITRQDAATVMGRLGGLSDGGIPSFPDTASIAAYAQSYVSAIQNARIMQGDKNGNFNPQKNLKWGEAIQMAALLVKYSEAQVPVRVININDSMDVIGSMQKGYINGVFKDAAFNRPSGLLVRDGVIYIADTDNSLVRQISGDKVSTYAGMFFGYDEMHRAVTGYKDGLIQNAIFKNPTGVLAIGDAIYVLDTGNNVIRKISGGTVSTYAGAVSAGFADGALLYARFKQPGGFCADEAGNIYVADTDNNLIRKISTDGMVSTVAGKVGVAGTQNGKTSVALFDRPTGIAYANGVLYIADAANNRIRMIKDGVVSTYAGSVSMVRDDMSGFVGALKDGEVLEAHFYYPSSLCVAPDGGVYVADTGNGAVRLIKDGKVTTIASEQDNDYIARPTGVAYADGVLYVADSFRNAIVRIEVSGR